MWPSDWPREPREIATAVDAAVAAARAGDAAAFREATGELAELPGEQVGLVLAAIVRELLETAHPDGLAGDDARAVLEQVVRGAAAWLPEVDTGAVVAALTGALGVADPEDTTAPAAVPPAAVLLTAHLADLARVPVRDYIRRALGEIARAETVEMP
ncbi:hypothetical protein [Nocardia farcinica]|uniref:hypothetical protein n=1 Tax=Nocardia farcinica TaxID=37329 RepID=UPI00189527BB|nr:hypothetical protein [Nocardia farcinica]MBF6270060.1 hypothetical protein [Nocardia farcinica]